MAVDGNQTGAMVGTFTCFNTLKLHVQQLVSMRLLNEELAAQFIAALQMGRDEIFKSMSPIIADTPWLHDFLCGVNAANDYSTLYNDAGTKGVERTN